MHPVAAAVVAGAIAVCALVIGTDGAAALQVHAGPPMGRATAALQFDFQGVAFAVQWPAGQNISSVAVEMTQIHTDGPTPPLEKRSPTPRRRIDRRHQHVAGRRRHQQGDADAPPYMPNMFEAYLFEGFADVDVANHPMLPFALGNATSKINFTTQGFASGESFQLTLFDASNGLADTHKAWAVVLVKVTEPDWNQIDFGPNYVEFNAWSFDQQRPEEGTTTDHLVVAPVVVKPAATKSVTPRLQRSTASPPPPPRFEFVGDSLTAGYCNLCIDSWRGEDFARTWGFRTAAHFGSSFHAEAWSGYGVVRNCCGGNTTMSMVFERTLATVANTSTLWNWSAFVPDIFVINLGANDHLNNTYPGPFEQDWVAAYTELVNTTTVARYAAYRDAAGASEPLHVFLACGSSQWAPTWCPFVASVKVALEELTARLPPPVPRVKFHFIAFEVPNNQHCCGHPDVEGDATMAAQLLSEIERLTPYRGIATHSGR